MSSLGVLEDILPGNQITVSGTIAFAPPTQISQINVGNTAPGTQLHSYQTIAANVGGTQATGTAIGAYTGIVQVTAAGTNYSVTLPPSTPGAHITIMATTSGDVLKVFPAAAGLTGASTEAINALGSNAAISMAALSSAVFVCVVAGQWWTIPRVPS